MRTHDSMLSIAASLLNWLILAISDADACVINSHMQACFVASCYRHPNLPRLDCYCLSAIICVLPRRLPHQQLWMLLARPSVLMRNVVTVRHWQFCSLD